MNFNPRAPCGARLPLEKHRLLFCLFQSTRPVRGATGSCGAYNHGNTISIHAPRAGRDIRPFTLVTVVFYFNPRAPCGARQSAYGQPWMYLRYFNPRAPCGARPAIRSVILQSRTFQSTRPVRGATGTISGTAYAEDISIHAPRAGRDPPSVVGSGEGGRFQSTRPVRGATLRPAPPEQRHQLFQSTRPVRGAT